MEPLFDPRLPYPSLRQPVLADAVVATSQPLAAAAGVRMLDLGGNAVDAAIATAMTLTVVEPTSNGLGSDAFALVWDGTELTGLNASGRSPAALSPERFAGAQRVPERGWDGVTVPGAVSAWIALWRRFGSLPLETLVEPAVRYAEEGYRVGPMTSRGWARAADTLAEQPGFAQAFLPAGRAPQAGERFRFPDAAATLRRIAETEGEAFYRGDLAERMAAFARETGGLLTEADLADHEPMWTPSIERPFAGAEVHELPPNGQGIAALMALGLLEHTPIAELDPDSADALHLEIEAMKLAFADLYRHVADPESMQVRPADLLDDAYLAERAKRIDPAAAAKPEPGVPGRGGTVYLCTADADGRMVSFIQSNFMGFGSGVVVPGTGISLQNRGAGFVLEPGHPNVVAGGKRPFHTIIPGFVTRGGQALAAFGVMGGAMQAQGHLQVMLRTLLYGQNPQAAIDAPRWQVLPDGATIAIERGFEASVYHDLEERGHVVLRDRRLASGERFFGGGQVAWRLEGGAYLGASDPRREGQALGR
ncbi:MAG TPA: gamma-glutamyltransferase family protein [Trueperaceae bacterium]|nr:gamma-glutamyltransferase family protein [Trueperaceae bacterium]